MHQCRSHVFPIKFCDNVHPDSTSDQRPCLSLLVLRFTHHTLSNIDTAKRKRNKQRDSIGGEAACAVDDDINAAAAAPAPKRERA
jgi:hypothetical protein